MIETLEIGGHFVEYYDDEHLYVVDGIIVPSITTLLKKKFNKKYENVNAELLNKRALYGTEIHKIIEEYETLKVEHMTCPELKNYKFLKKLHKFKCLKNEVIVLLKNKDNKIIGAGRLDMIIEKENKKGIADIKTTSTLDLEYLTYQLNLYRTAYIQTYNENIEFLAGIHLRGREKRKYKEVPIIEKLYEEF